MNHLKRIGAGLLVFAAFNVPYFIPHFGWIFFAITCSFAVVALAWLVGGLIVD